jgi:hypothetical protein
MKTRTLLAFLVLFSGLFAPIPASAQSPYKEIDKYALDAPADVERTIPDLVKYLIKPAKNDTEKVRAICRWTADRVTYDHELAERVEKARSAGKSLPDYQKRMQAETVLKDRKTVCAGYANLFMSMCKNAGIEAVTINGHLRGVPHGWNAVKIGGKWQLLDVTGMRGASMCEFFFLAPPEQLIFYNLPADPKWQLLQKPVSKKEFEKLMVATIGPLFSYGVSGNDVREKLNEKGFRALVKSSYVQGKSMVNTKIQKPPLDFHLKVGAKYAFRIESKDFFEIGIFYKGKFQAFERKDNIFEGEITAQPGEFRICGRVKEGDNLLHFVLEYLGE